MHNQPASYLSPKLEARLLPNKGGYGVYAREWLHAGELLSVWSGEIFHREQLVHLSPELRRYSLQVEEDLYLVTVHPPEPADFINHSCDPNAGLNGQISLVALRDIAPGEEICFDYATTDGSPYDEFECACGTSLCRGKVTGNDWCRPELWTRYAGHFSPYLQRRIDRLKKEMELLLARSRVVAQWGQV